MAIRVHMKGQMPKPAEALDVQRIALESRQIEQTLIRTKYQHVTQIDSATGTYNCDCSGFVSYVLAQVAPAHLKLIRKEKNWDRPRAFKYYEYFASLDTDSSQPWRRILHLSSCVPGDIIAWEETTADPPPANEDTGHVLIVAAPAQVIQPGLLSLAVYDSSQILHYDDSRAENGTHRTGVGTGTLRFQLDSTGHPSSVQFNAKTSFHAHPISIGRCQ